MLFKALLSRLSTGLSSSPSKTLEGHRRFVKSTYNKYPRLADLVVRLLEQSCSIGSKDLVDDDAQQIQFAFPAMEVIERVGVPSIHRDAITSLLMKQLESHVWNLREKAARTLSFLLDENFLIERLRTTSQSGIFKQNAVHGMLLCLHNLSDAGRFDSSGILSIRRVLQDINPGLSTAELGSNRTCSFIRQALLK